MEINCIVVDDEPASREVLEEYIATNSMLNLLASCKNAIEANEFICDHRVDLIFLDINMPKLSGLSFYKALNNPPAVIFTTAYPQHALEGFELNAVDYLLKPFDFERFLKAVNKVIERRISGQSASEASIVLKSDKKFYRVTLDSILYLEALGDYVRVFYDTKQILVHETFQSILARLNHPQVIRVHKSFAISLDKFDYVDGNMIRILGQSIPIGKTYRAEFFDRIQPTNSG